MSKRQANIQPRAPKPCLANSEFSPLAFPQQRAPSSGVVGGGRVEESIKMARKKRDSEGRFTGSGWMDSVRERPGASAAVVAGAAGLAAASAFLWTRRGQIGEALTTGMDRLSEMKAERMRSSPTQSEIAEEALTLKE